MKKKILKLKYPKFFLLVLTFVLAYFIFAGKNFEPFHNFLTSLGLVGVFLSGMMFTYGFTSGPATALFLILAKEHNILIAGLIGGLGAMFSDLFLFKFIRISFKDEIKRFSKEKIIKKVTDKIPLVVKKYVIPIFAGFIIASPLPDEIGISLLASSLHIKTKIFMLLSYLFNTIGIIIILAIGSVI